MSIFDDIWEEIQKLFDEFSSNYGQSAKWLEYKLGLTKTHCYNCLSRIGKIYDKTDYESFPRLPEHDRCACYLTALRSMAVGTATNLGYEGADSYLAQYGKLPDYYITKQKAYSLGWRAWKGNLHDVAPGKMIGGDIYENRDNKLPSAPGRIWYECDIDYQGGYRNNCRIIFSNDGLIFKTDDHYSRFISIE